MNPSPIGGGFILYINIGFPEDDLTGIERLLHIDDSLVGRAPEQEIGILEVFDERTIDQHIEQLQQLVKPV